MTGPARNILVALLGAVAFPHASEAQFRPARTLDYVFATGASDARAVWVNPAGLSVLPEASIMGEIVAERPDDETHFAQWTIGLNSRGFALAYRHDRFPGDSSMGTLRFGIGLPFTNGTVGFGASWYRVAGDDARDFDIGAMYGVTGSLNAAAVARHIGRPTVNGVPLPLTFAGGLHWAGLRGTLQLQAEGIAAERRVPGASGFDVGYRGGAILSLPRFPVTVLASIDLASDLEFNRLHIGIAVGGRNNVTAVGTGVSRAGDPTVAAASVTGVASNLLLGQR